MPAVEKNILSDGANLPGIDKYVRATPARFGNNDSFSDHHFRRSTFCVPYLFKYFDNSLFDSFGSS